MPLQASVLLLALLAGAASVAAAQKAKSTTVVIVGGGIAGVRAATILQAAGVDYVLLEATDKLGGRMRNTQITPYKGANLGPNGGEFVELGANWVQGLAGNPIYDLSIVCNLQGTPQNWDSVTTFDEAGQLLPDKNIPWRQFDNAMQCVASTVKSAIMAGTYKDLDARAAYRVCGWNPVKPIDYAVEWFSINYEWAETAEMVSANATQPDNVYVDFFDADIMATDQGGGMGKLVTCLAARGNVSSSQVLLNTKVTAFSVNNANKVAVTTTGGSWTADYVINTMPVGHIQRNVDALFGNLFSPAKKAALMEWRMGTYTKIFLKFKNAFWDPTVSFILQAPKNGQTNGVLWQSMSPSSGPLAGSFLPGSNILFMTYTDVMAASIESLPDEVVLSDLVRRLKEIYPQANTTGFELVGYVIPRWYTNDLFGGSFTNWPAGFTLDTFEAWRAPVGTPGPLSAPGKVLFSGEGACKRMNGYMPGAYGAGERSARQILQALGKPTTDPDENICERKLFSNGKPLGKKAHGSGRAA